MCCGWRLPGLVTKYQSENVRRVMAKTLELPLCAATMADQANGFCFQFELLSSVPNSLKGEDTIKDRTKTHVSLVAFDEE